MQIPFDEMTSIHYIMAYIDVIGGEMPVNRVKLARVERDLTQQELAERAGVARQTIGLIEAGSYNPTLSLCLKICHVLGKTLDQLFYLEDQHED